MVLHNHQNCGNSSQIIGNNVTSTFTTQYKIHVNHTKFPIKWAKISPSTPSSLSNAQNSWKIDVNRIAPSFQRGEWVEVDDEHQIQLSSVIVKKDVMILVREQKARQRWAPPSITHSHRPAGNQIQTLHFTPLSLSLSVLVNLPSLSRLFPPPLEHLSTVCDTSRDSPFSNLFLHLLQIVFWFSSRDKKPKP